MIRIQEKSIYKDGAKVGWLEGTQVFNHSGQKIGYLSGNDINNASGTKVAYLTGDDLKRVGHDSRIDIDKVNKEVVGGTLTELERSAVYVFFS